jgi:alanine dehydrogenase
MNIGIVRERSDRENRVPLTPAGVHSLVEHGARIYIEKGAGSAGRFEDGQYEEAGASIVYRAEEAIGRADLLLKVARPTMEELDMLRNGQAVFSFLHLPVAGEVYLKKLIDKKVTTIGFENVDDNGNHPILHPMSEIAGSMSIQIAARYLETTQGGRGILLGGIAGVPQAAVVILGAGVVGISAAQEALGAGAQVLLLDMDVERLRRAEYMFQRRITTAVTNQYNLSKAVRYADVLIGAVLIRGERSPVLITEEMVQTMKPGAVVIDISIDQGGCIETSRPTSLVEPVFILHDVIHYCVPNIPSAVARTATNGLNNALLPYLRSVVRSGMGRAIAGDPVLRAGVCTYDGMCTNERIAKRFEYEYTAPEKIFI